MKKLFFFLAIIAFSVAQTDADQAEGILESLLLDAQQNLNDLNTNWGINSGLLMENVNTWQGTLESQTEQCSNKDAIRDGTQEELNENTFKIQWIGEQNVLKASQSEDLYAARCEANRNYINGLKNDKILLKLIEFLRTAVSQHTSMNLIQRRQFAQTMMQFITLYRTKNTKDLLQLHLSISQNVDEGEYTIDNGFDVSQRTDEEVGDEHVDVERDDLELDGFESQDRSGAYQEILVLLDEMEAEILSKISTSQEDEIAAGITAAEYRIRLDKEVQELDQELYLQVTTTPKIEKRLILATAASEACQTELTSVTSSFSEAQLQFTSAQEQYNGKVTEINEEIEIFEYVLGLYQDNVSADQEYREQLDDYTVDGGYEGSYNQGEIDEQDFLTPEGEAQQGNIEEEPVPVAEEPELVGGEDSLPPTEEIVPVPEEPQLEGGEGSLPEIEVLPEEPELVGGEGSLPPTEEIVPVPEEPQLEGGEGSEPVVEVLPEDGQSGSIEEV